MKIPSLLKLCLALALGLLAPLALQAAQVTVFAAASLTESLQEIAATYQKATGDTLVFNFGASGLLAKQIEEGAPADLFFSADTKSLVQLRAKNLVGEGVYLLENTLVVVEPKEKPLPLASVSDLASDSFKKIALGEPGTVPAGTYAKNYLTQKNLWAAVSPKVVPCANVRAVLAAVETGNVDAGIVYRTDAAVSKTARIAIEIPAAEGPHIVYPAAVLTAAKNAQAAQKFLAYLGGKEASAVFVRHGFLLPKAGK